MYLFRGTQTLNVYETMHCTACRENCIVQDNNVAHFCIMVLWYDPYHTELLLTFSNKVFFIIFIIAIHASYCKKVEVTYGPAEDPHRGSPAWAVNTNMTSDVTKHFSTGLISFWSWTWTEKTHWMPVKSPRNFRIYQLNILYVAWFWYFLKNTVQRGGLNVSVLSQDFVPDPEHTLCRCCR